MVGRKTRLIFDAGDIIFREGEAGEVAYLVEKGSVQLTGGGVLDMERGDTR